MKLTLNALNFRSNFLLKFIFEQIRPIAKNLEGIVPKGLNLHLLAVQCSHYLVCFW